MKHLDPRYPRMASGSRQWRSLKKKLRAFSTAGVGRSTSDDASYVRRGTTNCRRTAISRLRMYFRFDNSILAPAVRGPSASGKNNPRRLRRVSSGAAFHRPAGREFC